MATSKEFRLEDGKTVARSLDHHAILDDPELDGLTLYEKKALLVNRELDAHRMGKYQWYIFFLCGFGYLIDLLYAQAFGLVAPALQQELGFGDDELGNIFTSFASGLTAGAFVWGVLVDIIGRQYAFNLTVLISATFGLCLAGPSTYNGILVLAAFVGFGIGGNIPIDTTICLEFLPQNRRFLLAMLSIFQPIGVVITTAICYGFIPKYSCANYADGNPALACNSPKLAPGQACCTKASNMGWRYVMLTLGAVCLTVFFLRFVVFRFQESPKFLLYRGKDEKAVEVLHNIAKFNKRQSTITLEAFAALTDEDASIRSRDSDSPILGAGAKQKNTSFNSKIKIELSRYKILFATSTMTRLTLLVWLTYMFDYWGFSIAGSFLPTILLRKNATIHVSKEQTYLNFVYIYLCGIPGVLTGALMYAIPLIGRKWGMVISSALMGISLFLFSVVNTQGANIGLNATEYFFQSMFNAILYGWTPEAFPAPIRGTASGLASFWGRIFSIVSPLIGAHLLTMNLNGPLYLAGAGVFVCTIAILFLPTKYMGAQSY